MVYGTPYFISYLSAVKYYGMYEKYPEEVVRRKIAEKEIYIEKPVINPNQKLLTNYKEGRYFIKEETQC